jgi:hypothetical protein
MRNWVSGSFAFSFPFDIVNNFLNYAPIDSEIQYGNQAV